MADLTPSAMATFARYHGNATSKHLLAAGLPPRTRRRLLAAGVLELVYESVYRIASAPDTLESQCAALCLAHPAGFITGPTAGRLEGLRRMPKTEELHFCLPHGHNFHPKKNVVLHQSRSIEVVDIRRRSDGINVASPPRLAFDLGNYLDVDAHASVVEQILYEKRCTLATLAWIGRRLIHPARPGSLRFATLLGDRVRGPAAASDPELRVLNALRDRGIPVVTQHRILALPNGRKVRIDIAVPDLCWGVEVDIHPWHLLLEGTARDKRRDRQCHLIGWEVERVTVLDLADFDALIDELCQLYEVRRAQFNTAQAGN